MQGKAVRDELAEAYASLLVRHPWHWFASLAFNPAHERTKVGGVHPEKADKAFRFWMGNLNREIYGPRWAKKPHGGLVWARGQEFHKDGRIHFHALVAASTDDLNRLARRLTWLDNWYEQFGFARIERPRSDRQVCSYVSKYVVKDGEVDFSKNFGRVSVPAISYEAIPRQGQLAHLVAHDMPGDGASPGQSLSQESGLNQRAKPTGPRAAFAPRDREPEGSNGTALGDLLPVA